MATKEKTSLAPSRVEEGNLLEGMRPPLSGFGWSASYADESYAMPPLPAWNELTRGYFFERSSVFMNQEIGVNLEVLKAYAGSTVDVWGLEDIGGTPEDAEIFGSQSDYAWIFGDHDPSEE